MPKPNRKRNIIVGFQVAGVKGWSLLKAVADHCDIAYVSSYPLTGTQDDSFEKIREFCQQRKIHFVDRKKMTPIDTAGAEMVFVAGWQFLISDVDDRFVVFHDSLLPKFRGFSPTVTALILGEKTIGVTALRPNGECDQGPIYGQARVQVKYPMRIRDAYALLADAYASLAIDLIRKRSVGKIQKPRPQTSKNVSYSIWRNPADYRIDWNRPAVEIERLINAVGWPYMGAKSPLNGKLLTILSGVAIKDLAFEIRHPGKLWRVQTNQADVICGKGMLRITEAKTEDGAPYVFDKLRQRFE